MNCSLGHFEKGHSLECPHYTKPENPHITPKHWKERFFKKICDAPQVENKKAELNLYEITDFISSEFELLEKEVEKMKNDKYACSPEETAEIEGYNNAISRILALIKKRE